MDGFLAGLQVADSFLPVGNYSSSYALEQFAESGRVHDIDDVDRLLDTYLRRQVGTMDLVALRAAYQAVDAEDVDELVRTDERLHAMTLPAEFRTSATRAGVQLCELWQSISTEAAIVERYVDRDPPQQYAVVQGMVTATEGLPMQRACLVYCYGFCSSMLGAAQRLLSLGHTDVQACLRGQWPTITDVVDASDDRSIDEMSSFTPEIDIQSACHERADRRLFMS